MLFEVKNLKKSYNRLSVLKDISFSVDKGEVVAIIGSSGSGKTTLLRICTGLTEKDEGEITKLSNVGLVFQNFNLFPHWTVLKNLTDAPITVQKKNAEEVKKSALYYLEKMGLSGKENYYPCMLSGGQQQRVAIARALLMDPEIIFFDEPTSALDPELTYEVLKVIKDLAKENRTMVIVTHEINFARDVADRIIFMDNGQIIEEGNAKDLVMNPKKERTKEFLKRYSMA